MLCVWCVPFFSVSFVVLFFVGVVAFGKVVLLGLFDPPSDALPVSLAVVAKEDKAQGNVLGFEAWGLCCCCKLFVRSIRGLPRKLVF